MFWLRPFAPFLSRQLEALKSQQQGVPYWMLAIDLWSSYNEGNFVIIILFRVTMNDVTNYYNKSAPSCNRKQYVYYKQLRKKFNKGLE